MNPEYIIVQAGGKGTRLKHLTRNKPKALVPVDNLPMLFHLFRKYPQSKYIIIGDYHYDVLERYLAVFAPVQYQMVCATGQKGTCAGLQQAVSLLPEESPFLLIWSDLILPKDFSLPGELGNYIGIAKDFPCRWKYENGAFAEEQSDISGVAGVFYFESRAALAGIPLEGELVKWLSTQTCQFREMPLRRVKEYGLLSEYNKMETARCRPFNRVYVNGDFFIKEPLDEQGKELAHREAAWYQHIADQGFSNIPKIISYHPLKMEYIHGKPIYEYERLSREKKTGILRQIISCLKAVQNFGEIPADPASYWEAYVGKTFRRLEKVRCLVPFATGDEITINGRKCQNVFQRQKELENALMKYIPTSFRFIHGDCTFSNTMLREDGTPVLIDPRGYFGYTELYGDPAYDWAKLYYSIVGNYDQFNRKHFDLIIREKDVTLQIASNGWEILEGEFFELLEGMVEPQQIKLIHAIIWLSLTTYAWENYDSICGAFYNGLYYLEEAL